MCNNEKKYQNVTDSAKAVLKGKFIYICNYKHLNAIGN